MELAGGALIFGLFLVVFTLAVTYGLYSRRGSGIDDTHRQPVRRGLGSAQRRQRARGRRELDARDTLSQGWAGGARLRGPRAPARKPAANASPPSSGSP